MYTGWTTDIRRRLKAHRNGTGAKYTKYRTPLELVYLEVFDSRSEAMRREAAIKRLTRTQKLVLVEESNWKENLMLWGLSDLELN